MPPNRNSSDPAYDLIEQGLLAHNQGKVAQAEDCYRRALELDDGNCDALHLLGVAALQTGRLDQAAELIGKAIDRDADSPEFHNSLGQVQQARRDPDAALASYRRALALMPEYAEAQYNLANCLRESGSIEQSVSSYREAIRLNPNLLPAYVNLSIAQCTLGEPSAAILTLQRALSMDGRNASSLYHLGLAFLLAGRAEEGIQSLEKTLEIKPDMVGARVELAAARYRQGRALIALKQYRQAAESFSSALALDSGMIEARRQLGEALMNDARYAEALQHFDLALRVEPDQGMLHNQRGLALKSLGDLSGALAGFREAIRLDPGLRSAYANVGDVLRELHDPARGAAELDESLENLRRGLALHPDAPELHYRLAELHLLRGEFEAGWREYEWRYTAYQSRRVSSLMPLQFECRHILLVREQGLGEELFFLRFAPRAKALGARLTYRSSPKIETMLRRVPALDQVVTSAIVPSDAAYVIAVGDLPRVLAGDQACVQPPPLQLTALAEKCEALRHRLVRVGRGPYLGVTWRAGAKAQSGTSPFLFKEVPVEGLGRVLGGWPGPVIVLQRNMFPGEIDRFSAALGREAHDFSDLNEDLEAMLALLDRIDEYVCVSNTNIYLRSGLGKTARVLVPHPPEWRWMAQGDESPWFPGSRIYRQGIDRGWDHALARLAADLGSARA